MNYHAMIEWAYALWDSARSLLGLPPNTGYGITMTDEQLASLQEFCDSYREKTRALEAARSGEGPQPWDQDWPENEQDLSEEIRQLATKAGWHRLQHLCEVLQWALQSPQGQRALASVQDGPELGGNSPWLEPLRALAGLYLPIMEVSHEMLRKQARGLNYSQASTDELEATLRLLRERKHSISA